MKFDEKANGIVQRMLEKDAFSQWLGIELLTVGEGHCSLRMTLRTEMLNGFGIAHGGITYSLADSALAFASNAQGRKAVSVETSISHTRALHAGDILVATAEEEHLGDKIGIYRVMVRLDSGETVAVFKGVVYRTGKDW
jgi:acyl-CoA thioesterase